MLVLACWIPLLAHQPHHIIRDTRHLGRLPGILQEHLLCDQCLCPRVLQLSGELLNGVCRIGWRGDATGPLHAEVNDGIVNGVG